MDPAHEGRVLVIGATGTIGREVVAQLLAAGVPVRALSRHPEHAALPGAEVVSGDLTLPGTLDAAVRGVETVFLVWTAPAASVAGAIQAIARQARRIVFLSSPHQTPHPFFQQPNPIAALHAAIEREIEAAGLASIILRPGMFASNAGGWWAPQVREGGVVRWPYAAAASAPVDERDIGAVAALVLRDERHAGAQYVLTGPESLTHAEQVAIIGEVTGRPLRYEEMEPAEFRRVMAERGAPAVADMLLNAWSASVGLPAYVTPTVAEVTGRPPRTFRQWAADHADAFRPDAAARPTA
ncbi:MAG TPA: NmrA family NAD(P)-binding protein [Longimicrobium sp.]|nr:NmrA family NAD(P)-binding protein [Longimicrobium sp.]